MNKSMSDIYLYSDIDGTLGITGQGIPQRNIEAIQRFVHMGGNFGIATGRWITDIPDFIKDIPINLPCIVNNGCAIYDFQNNVFIKNTILPENAVQFAKEIQNEYSGIDLLAVDQSGCYYCHTTGKSPIFPEETSRYKSSNISDIGSNLANFLFLVDPGRIRAVVNELNSKKYHGVQFVQSSSNGFEMLAKSNNKGSALLEICDMYSYPLEGTVFIGDNYNDKEMFSTAAFSACISSTPNELKHLCNIVLGSCLSGAVADLIDLLEKLTVFARPFHLCSKKVFSPYYIAV